MVTRVSRKRWFAVTKSMSTGNSQQHPHSDAFFSRNVQALSRNIGVVLRNVERKCAAKGIIWLASPVPSKGGKPSAFLWGLFHSLFCSLL